MSYTPEEITEILEAYFESIAHRQYIGARYVPIFGRKDEESIDWDGTAPYEPLTIVLHEGNSYTSRQYVPAGVAITNQDYWALTGNYNAQVESYRAEVANLANMLPDSDFSAVNTVKKYIDDSISFDVEKVRAFDTVADMKAADNLLAGMVCRTNGFYAANDGGAAWYVVTDTGTANEMDIVACGDLYANLIVGDVANASQMGLDSSARDTSNNNATIVNYALTTYKNVCVSANRVYFFTSQINVSRAVLDGNYSTFRFYVDNDADIFINVDVFCTVKNLKVSNAENNKQGHAFNFHNYDVVAASRNTNLENIDISYCKVACYLNRSWVNNFKNIDCSHLETCYYLEYAVNALEIQYGNYENDVVNFLLAADNSTSGNLSVMNATIESFTGYLFKFDNLTSNNSVLIEGCYFENGATLDSDYGCYPLIKGVSPHDMYTVSGCNIAYNTTIDVVGFYEVVNCWCTPKAKTGKVPKAKLNQPFARFCSIDAPSFTDYQEIIDFRANPVVKSKSGSASTLFYSEQNEDYMFLFYDATGTIISDTEVDLSQTAIRTMQVFSLKPGVVHGFMAADVTYVDHTPQSQGSGGFFSQEDGTTGTGTYAATYKIGRWITQKMHQQTMLSIDALAGTQGGYSYSWRGAWGTNNADSSYKLNVIAFDLN